MNARPPATAPGPPADALRAVDRELRRRRPGQQLAAAFASSNSRASIQPRRSTHSSRSSATCAGGPPKPIDAEASPLAHDRAQADPFPRHSSAHGVRSGETLV